MTSARTSIVITDTGVWAGTARCTDGSWSIAAACFRPCSVPASLRPDSDLLLLADEAIEAVRTASAEHALTRLIVPATWVLTHAIHQPPGRFRKPAARFELERFLPVALEELTCTFVPAEQEGLCTGLALPTQPILGLLNRLAKADIQVELIVPDYVAPPSAPVAESSVMSWCDQSHVSLALWRNGRPTELRSCRLNGTPAPTILRSLAAMLPDSVDGTCVTFAGQISDELNHATTENLDCTVSQLANGGTDQPPELLLLPSTTDEAFNLRIDALAFGGRHEQTHRNAVRCAALVVVMLLAFTLVSWLQERDYHRAIADLQTHEREIYASVFPRQPVPPGAALRLASERRRLEGLTRTEASPTAETGSELMGQLREIVAVIPEKARINVQELRLDRRELVIRGLTASHRDAEQIAASLRRIKGLEPHPPRSDALKEGGVSFSLRADASSRPHQPDPNKSFAPTKFAAAGTVEKEGMR